MFLKRLVDVDNDTGQKSTVSSSLATIEGRLKSEDVLIYGIKNDSNYVDIDAASLKSDEVYVTYGYAEKFQIKKGDKNNS